MKNSPSATDAAFIAATYFNDPVGYVRDVIRAEPDEWQRGYLESILDHKRIAVASGHGIGKTAAIAWTIHWFIATRPDPQIVVTANTRSQLTSKTWRELAKWNHQALNGKWFVHTATQFYLASSPETWFASAIPWTENNSEAFAGTHERHVLMLFDEASTIADKIWEVAEGAMTTEDSHWVAFGNPTRNTGAFHRCFHADRERWHCKQIDSRTVKMTNKEEIAGQIKAYGEDSDFVRVRVKGEFPRAGSCQFISGALVEAATAYQAQGWQHLPKILGVDVARFGDDSTVLCRRQGRKVFPLDKYKGLDTMQVAARVARLADQWLPDVLIIDGVGIGAGVVDRLRQLGFGDILIDCNAGSEPDDPKTYFNKRAEMWGEMRKLLEVGLDLPDDRELRDDLIGPEYFYTPKQQIQLERKSDMKKRGLASPDCADALALTFAVNPRKRLREEAPVETFEPFDEEMGY